MMKRFAALALVLIMALASVGTVFGTGIGVTVNGVPLAFDEASGMPFIDQAGRTMVPLRLTMESCGCLVSWMDGSKTATIQKGKRIAHVQVGDNILSSGDVFADKETPMDTEPVIVNGRVYLPIRAVLEEFGALVDWDPASKTVTVQMQGLAPADVKPGQVTELSGYFGGPYAALNQLIGISATGEYNPRDGSVSQWFYTLISAGAKDMDAAPHLPDISTEELFAQYLSRDVRVDRITTEGPRYSLMGLTPGMSMEEATASLSSYPLIDGETWDYYSLGDDRYLVLVGDDAGTAVSEIRMIDSSEVELKKTE